MRQTTTSSQRSARTGLKHTPAPDSEGPILQIRETSLVPLRSNSLATVLGIDDKKIDSFLTIYSPARMEELVQIANINGLDPLTLIRFDLKLMLDECSGREDNSKFLSSTHQRLLNLITGELERNAGSKLLKTDLEYINKLWSDCLAEFDNNEEDAADKFELLLSSDLKEIAINTQSRISVKTLFEVFKLFNYRPDALNEFVEFVEDNFAQANTNAADSSSAIIFGKLLKKYLRGTSDLQILNPNSKMYSFAMNCIFNRKTRQFEQDLHDPDNYSVTDDLQFQKGDD